MSVTEGPLYHVTTLSNFARAFDKYSRRYCKSRIPESSHPNESYLVPATQLSFGAAKASRLVRKLAIPGDAPLALQAGLSHWQVDENRRTGIGVVWSSPDLPISGTFAIAGDGTLGPAISLEDAMARSLELHSRRFAAYSELRPRTLSFLPIARGCQAACPFCFSDASASADQRGGRFRIEEAGHWVEFARSRGAQRAVITGGGEPTLLPWDQLIELVRICSSAFPKTVLITNGAGLASTPKPVMIARLRELASAGLSVLAISRHHPSEEVNADLMRFETMTAWAERNGLRVTDRLPWGAPIFSGACRDRHLRVAAYTEPSLFWERSNALARSWNVMASGQCLASLEDRRSLIILPCEGVLQ
ncbi:MAG TPA: radical SAM protein [Steroidobacteraceae bacterium]|nr:radical SAM protein [Steroidobacteraceae bacterium]